MIGYSEESKAYRLWLTEDKKVISSRDVKFMNTFQPEDNGTISTTDHNSLLDPFAEEGEVSRSNPIAEEGGVQIEPDYRRRGSVGTMSETEHEERTWKDTKRENWKSGKAT